MNRKALTYISLSLLCSVGLLAQNWRPTDKEWTDKNNTEKYAAYLLTQRTTAGLLRRKSRNQTGRLQAAFYR